MVRYLVLSLLLLAGCDGALRDPVGVGSGGGPGTIGNGGGGGGDGNGGGSPSVLVGSWKADFVFQLSNDVQRHTTIWSFGRDGSCRRSVEVYSVLEDRTRTTVSTCTFESANGQVAITYAGSPGPVTFRWSLAGFSRNRLILDGVTYDRIA